MKNVKANKDFSNKSVLHLFPFGCTHFLKENKSLLERFKFFCANKFCFDLRLNFCFMAEFEYPGVKSNKIALNCYLLLILWTKLPTFFCRGHLKTIIANSLRQTN